MLDQLPDAWGAQSCDPVQLFWLEILAQASAGEGTAIRDQRHLGQVEPLLKLANLSGHRGRIGGAALEDLDDHWAALGIGE